MYIENNCPELELCQSNVKSMINYYVYANVDKEADLVEVGASTLDGKKEVHLDKVNEAFATYSLIEWRLNHLVGRILTQCDATFSDPVQRKAVKDVIRQFFADEFGFFGDHLQRGLIENSLKGVEEMSDEEFKEWVKENPPVGIDEVIAPGK